MQLAETSDEGTESALWKLMMKIGRNRWRGGSCKLQGLEGMTAHNTKNKGSPSLARPDGHQQLIIAFLNPVKEEWAVESKPWIYFLLAEIAAKFGKLHLRQENHFPQVPCRSMKPTHWKCKQMGT